MNTPINFELAKLLKEKGFEQNPMKHINQVTMNGTLVFPTIAEVVTWLYEKHGIWISVDFNLETSWFYDIVVLSGEGGNILDNFDSPIEAYEAAIDYTLNNLI